MFQARYAILIDGGFVTKKLQERLKRPATAGDIVDLCSSLRAVEHVSSYELLRTYYYDGPPSQEKVDLPVSDGAKELAKTERYKHAQSLYDQLEMKPGLLSEWGKRALPQ